MQIGLMPKDWKGREGNEENKWRIMMRTGARKVPEALSGRGGLMLYSEGVILTV